MKVTQFHFTAWPDHGVPEYATPILAFHKKIKKHHKPSKGAILVHCRCTNTVAFTDLYILLQTMRKELVLSIITFRSFIDKPFHFYVLLSQCGFKQCPYVERVGPFNKNLSFFHG